MIPAWIDRICLRAGLALLTALIRRRGSLRTWTGSRQTSRFVLDDIEYTLVQRMASQPEHYTREELHTMLAIVRREEQRMQWKCPDPTPTKFTTGSVTLNEHRNLVLGLARALNGVVNYAPADRREELNDVVLAAQLAVSRRIP